MNKFIIAISFLLLVSSGNAQDKQYDLYLLLGQSNMAGRGAIAFQDSVIPARVASLNRTNKWVVAQDPIHFDKKVAGVGLGRTFGIELAKKTPYGNIGLIPCAVGGSSIDCWKPGGYHEQTNTYPWDDMEKRIKVALKSGKIKGVLWHQGESDSKPENCKEYKVKLEDLIQRIRKLCGDENLPFVAGELGKFYVKKQKNTYPKIKRTPAEIVVRSTKRVAKNDSKVGFVSSNGLKHKGDITHFNAKSYRTLGKRYAKEMLKLQKDNAGN